MWVSTCKQGVWETLLKTCYRGKSDELKGFVGVKMGVWGRASKIGVRDTDIGEGEVG